ncbi:hypothetical protein F5Y13DRAFT_91609 [Hypoxylon sp. FL1857]|nr:hypothetical protein F5Y13DRAFT_91609 [Hypoxylon sp. FL1857]
MCDSDYRIISHSSVILPVVLPRDVQRWYSMCFSLLQKGTNPCFQQLLLLTFCMSSSGLLRKPRWGNLGSLGPTLCSTILHYATLQLYHAMLHAGRIHLALDLGGSLVLLKPQFEIDRQAATNLSAYVPWQALARLGITCSWTVTPTHPHTRRTHLGITGWSADLPLPHGAWMSSPFCDTIIHFILQILPASEGFNNIKHRVQASVAIRAAMLRNGRVSLWRGHIALGAL